jgi:hypothetical protein
MCVRFNAEKAGIEIKCPRFFIWKAIQYIGVMVSGVKPLNIYAGIGNSMSCFLFDLQT